MRNVTIKFKWLNVCSVIVCNSEEGEEFEANIVSNSEVGERFEGAKTVLAKLQLKAVKQPLPSSKYC